MRALFYLWSALLLACAGPEPTPKVTPLEDALAIEGATPFSRVELWREGGSLVQERVFSDPTRSFLLDTHGLEGGRYTLVGYTATGAIQTSWTQPERPACEVDLTAPLGTTPRWLHDGQEIHIQVLGDAPVAIRLRARPATSGPLALRAGQRQHTDPNAPATLPQVLDTTLEDALDLEVTCAGQTVRSHLQREHAPFDPTALTLTALTWPARADGSADPVLPQQSVALPARWLTRLFERLHLPVPLHDPDLPWGYAAVHVAWRGSYEASAVASLSVRDKHGEIDPAFRPTRTPRIETLVTLRPHEERTVLLPIALDMRDLIERPELPDVNAVVEVALLGSHEPPARLSVPIALTPSRPIAWISGLIAALAGVFGFAGALMVLPRWLTRQSVTTLSQLATFSALLYAAAIGAQLSGLFVAGLLGPLGVFVSAALDELLSVALLCILVTLRPKPGVVATVTLTTGLLRGITLGTLAPTDFLALGAAISWLEGALWVFGITRGDGSWRDARLLARTTRLAAAFATSSVLGALTGLALYASLFRAYYATWYVVAIAVGPGYLYPVIASVLAAPVAAALRKVAS